MRLYLSSFLMGDHPEHLRTLVGQDDRGAVAIANALDHVPAEARRSRVERELAALAEHGFDAVELDLRDYFGQRQRLRHDLAEASLAWLTGGNVFMLRYALSRSGADAAFGDLLAADAAVIMGRLSQRRGRSTPLCRSPNKRRWCLSPKDAFRSFDQAPANSSTLPPGSRDRLALLSRWPGMLPNPPIPAIFTKPL